MRFSVEEVVSVETDILLSLDFRLNPVTIDDSMNVLMHRWDCYLQQDASDAGRELQTYSPLFRQNNVNSIMIYQQACIIVDACLYWNNPNFNGLELVAAILYFVVKIFIG